MTTSALPMGSGESLSVVATSRTLVRWLRRAALVIVVLIAAWALAWAVDVARTVASISDETLRAALNNPVVVFRVKDGEILLDGANVNRTLRPDEMPRDMALLLLSTEDRRFHQHGAIDLIGIARAVVANATSLGFSEGASTLTMQLAKTSLAGSSRSLSRKLVEIVLAVRIERAYAKKEILALYLSRVEFGRVRGIPVYGLRDAAAVYFDTVPEDLSTAECAILVAMLNGTSLYDPVRNPDGVTDRAKRVVARASAGLEDPPAWHEIVEALPGKLASSPLRDRYLEDHVLHEVDALGLDLPDGLYRAVTSIDPIAQWQARRVVRAELSEAGPAFEGAPAALLTLDREGRVLAMLGGTDYLASSANAAMSGERRLGSMARLAPTLAAFSAGWTLETIVREDGNLSTGGEAVRGDGASRGAAPLERCVLEADDACMSWLAGHVGDAAVTRMARALGIAGAGDSAGAIARGDVEGAVVDIVAAYAALSNEGPVPRPQALLALLGPQGRVLFDAPPSSRTVVADPGAIESMRELLSRGVPTRSSGDAFVEPATGDGRMAMAADAEDGAWFVGITPDGITTGVWVGRVEAAVAPDAALPERIFTRYDRNLEERFAAYGRGQPLPR